ncbi:MAG TPA: YigZ family protein [Anaerolineae bacterium]|nr:YigZ family protein [Caldilineae bacterium]HID33562.1 YigZ family protein [Anaerolineae bacterium]
MPANRYPIPARTHRVEEVIRRSRFIATVSYAPTVADARAFIQTIRQEFPDATHNVWAYLVGPPGSAAQMGYSDDGEPHGAAGRPAFTVLQHSGIGDIVAVITRYFGGVKLGKGGLARAYRDGVKQALATLPLAEHRVMATMEVVIPYAFITPLQRLLPDYEAKILSEEYGADAAYRLQLPLEHSATFADAVIGLTHGAALIAREKD